MTRFDTVTLPYGVFSVDGGPRRVGVAIGDHVLDLVAAFGDETFATGSLNAFLAKGRAEWRHTRRQLETLVSDPSAAEPHLRHLDDVTMHLPIDVADYVDFYASEHHAANLGRLLRPGEPPLTPNWKHMPIGYHGRSGTVVVSGTPVVRPCGQLKGDADAPRFAPSDRLDIEVELGFVVGTPSTPGAPVATEAFADHVFGVVLFNDWSARDIQAWEYRPLGPFLGKSFASSVSPWVVPLDALAAARVPGAAQDPEPLPYLARADDWGLDLSFEVRLNGEVVSRPSYRHMYWTPDQMLAHLTANGASTRTGDLYASGTVSGPGPGELGSFMEISQAGREPLTLTDGSTRTFLRDGDEVTVTGTAPGPDGATAHLGEVSGRIAPARSSQKG